MLKRSIESAEFVLLDYNRTKMSVFDILQEVYVEILTCVISHTEQIPSDLIDSSAIPITASIIREGPW